MVRLSLNGLPKSLDETYERILKGIPEENRTHTQRLLQCLAVAIRPLRVEELAEILTLDFDATEGELPRFNANRRSKDQEHDVLSACSSLIIIVDNDYGRVVQFSHFSVKEYLTSDRLATSSKDISNYYILPDAAHMTFAQASLRVLLRLDDHIDARSALSIPLANYAAQNWFFHAQVGSISSQVLGMMKTLFDSDKPHFAVWVQIHDIDPRWPKKPATPLYYSVLCGFYDLIEHLVKKTPQHVNCIGGGFHYPLMAALYKVNIIVAELLLQHGANVNARGSDGRTLLHTASGWSKNLAVGAVWFLLNHGADVNDLQNDPSSPLHMAVAVGNLEVAQMLLEHRVDVNYRNFGGWTALQVALKSTKCDRRFNFVQLLLKFGAGVNSRDKEYATALHDAAIVQNLEVVRVLLIHGADINAKNSQGRTPFHQLFQSSYSKDLIDVARLLVEHGANVNTRDRRHETPLHLTSHEGNVELVRVLLDHGANVNVKNDQGQTPLYLALHPQHLSQDNFGVVPLLIDHGADVNTGDNVHETPLHLASRKLDLESVRVLLDHDANINAKNNQGQTPLHQVFCNYSVVRGCAITRLLVERGADVNAQDEDHNTPLHLASRRRNLESVRVLLNHGANVDAKNNEGQTPLHQVPELQHSYGCSDIAQLLLERGADVNAAGDNDHDTPLHLASYFLHLELVRMFLDHGAKINAKDNLGRAPLHRALEDKDYRSYADGLAVAKQLMECGADVNTPNNDHETPLHLASRHMLLDTAWIILRHGADINVENKEGKTPFQLVRESLRGEMKQPPSEYSTRAGRARRAQGVELMALLYNY